MEEQNQTPAIHPTSLANVSPSVIRRSNRANRGKMSRYENYVESMEATATRKPNKTTFMDLMGVNKTDTADGQTLDITAA